MIAPEVAAVASRLPSSVRFGTSSWSFPGWAGIVWAGAVAESVLARDGLTAYARHPLLRAVGLDRTFYAPLAAPAFTHYASQVPEDFRFVVKAHDVLTRPRVRAAGGAWERNPRFLDATYAADAVVRPASEGLGERLGVILYQCAPGVGAREPARFAEVLHRFLDALPKGVLAAVEVRAPQAMTRAYAAALRAAGASHVYNVHPTMPPIEEQARVVVLEDQPALVVRFMLGGGLEYDTAKARYAPFDRIVDEAPDARHAITGLVASALSARKSATVIVNNKAEGSAPLTVLALATMLARSALP